MSSGAFEQDPLENAETFSQLPSMLADAESSRAEPAELRRHMARLEAERWRSAREYAMG